MDRMRPYVALFQEEQSVLGLGRRGPDWDLNVRVPKTWHFAGLRGIGDPMGVDATARDATSTPNGRIVSTTWVQRALNATGRYSLQVDGIAGRRTMDALQSYWARIGSPAPQPGFLPSGVTASGVAEDRVLIPRAMERLLAGLRQVQDPVPQAPPAVEPPPALPPAVAVDTAFRIATPLAVGLGVGLTAWWLLRRRS